MMHRYAEWCRRQARGAQCNPALMVLGFIVAAGIVVYVYRQAILTTLEVGVLACASIVFIAGCIALTISTIRWYRKRAAEARSLATVATVPEPEATDDDTKAISDEADWLASGVELAWSPDGKTLRAKAPK